MKPKFPKARIYEILSRAIEAGVAHGWRRAHKYSEDPGEEVIKHQIEQEVMSAICEIFEL